MKIIFYTLPLHRCTIASLNIFPMSKIIYHVDAFTDAPFKGNPAGVCFIERDVSSEWMQLVACEMNLSETAFIIPGAIISEIRFFTPEAEVPLCGHATLSSAHIIYETKMLTENEEISFLSKAGELRVRKRGDWITMNFPAYSVNQIPVPVEIEKIIGITPLELYKSAFGWTLALISDEQIVREMKPDFRMMKNSEFGDLIVTAKSEESGFDFCVRCFAPALGIDEDPVTGSAHCALVPFWNRKTGKTDFVSHQVSKRSGILKVRLEGERVEISGQAKTISRAELFV
jgi:PhzF family phenazine biosynthesis protein